MSISRTQLKSLIADDTTPVREVLEKMVDSSLNIESDSADDVPSGDTNVYYSSVNVSEQVKSLLDSGELDGRYLKRKLSHHTVREDESFPALEDGESIEYTENRTVGGDFVTEHMYRTSLGNDIIVWTQVDTP